MDVTKLSDQFAVRFLTEADTDAIYELAAANPMFYHYCPPFVTKAGIAADMKELPPGMTCEDKYYLGFFDHTKLVAVMDLITGYPDSSTVFIGFFMVSQTDQGKGMGSSMIAGCSAYIRSLGYSRLRLAFAKGNPQSEAFWKKNGFVRTGEESRKDAYTAVLMQKELD